MTRQLPPCWPIFFLAFFLLQTASCVDTPPAEKPVVCADLNCGTLHRECITQSPQLAECGACLSGFEEHDGACYIIEDVLPSAPTCAELACETTHQVCVTDPRSGAACGDCLPSYHLSDEVCVLLPECEELACETSHQQCVPDAVLGATCGDCLDGFALVGEQCEDINECEDESGICGDNSICTNTEGAYDCSCEHGFAFDAHEVCQDIDECEDESGVCGDNSICTNTEGAYDCSCEHGFAFDAHEVCQDIDECEDENICGPNSICTNTEGAYECSCEHGFAFDAHEVCQDIDECEDENICGPTGICTNTEGSYDCDCGDGLIRDKYGLCFLPFDTISGGQQHTCGTSNGRAFCWGFNWSGEIGREVQGSRNEIVSRPYAVGTATDWQLVLAGSYASCGLRANKLYCWGTNEYGMMGADSDTLPKATEPIPVFPQKDWQELALGWQSTCAISSGELYCWGYNKYGNLGNGTAGNTAHTHVAQRVGDGDDWQKVTTSSDHSCGIRAGKLYCWGRNHAGQLGIGSLIDQSTPQEVPMGTHWTHIAAGGAHTCGIESGKLYCWGSNADRQLGQGNGPMGNLSTPTQVGDSDEWTDVSVAYASSCAINDGDAYCWGFGYLGTDEYVELNTNLRVILGNPSKVHSVVRFPMVTAGQSHFCAIHERRAYCWGENRAGELGDGTTVIRLVPTRVVPHTLPPTNP